MSELPACKLCGSDPDTNWAPLVTREDGFGAVTVSVEKFSCSKRTCTLNGVLCTEDQWRLLHDQSQCAEQQRIIEDLRGGKIKPFPDLEPQRALEGFQSRCAELEAEVLKLNRELAESNTDHWNAENAKAKLEARNQDHAVRIAQLSGDKLRLEAENAALRERIEMHNQECRSLCMGKDCPTYRPEKDRCCDCSKDWLLHIDDLTAPHQPAQSEGERE